MAVLFFVVVVVMCPVFKPTVTHVLYLRWVFKLSQALHSVHVPCSHSAVCRLHHCACTICSNCWPVCKNIVSYVMYAAMNNGPRWAKVSRCKVTCSHGHEIIFDICVCVCVHVHAHTHTHTHTKLGFWKNREWQELREMGARKCDH